MKLISQAVHGVFVENYLKWNMMCFKISKSLCCVINCMWTVEDNSDVFFVLFFNWIDACQTQTDDMGNFAFE